MAITIPLHDVTVTDPDWGPVERQYASYNPNDEDTLVVMLHGGGGSVQTFGAQTSVIQLVRDQAVRCGVLMLQGIDYDPTVPVGSAPSIIVSELQRLPALSTKPNAHNWNDGRVSQFTNVNGFVAFDDVLFITQMIGLFTGVIGNLADTYDPTRVFIMGASNGGHMAQRYTIEKPNLVQGVGVIASTQPFSARLRAEPGPMKVWWEHGTLDPLNGYHGASRADDTTQPVINRIAYWKRQNNLDPGAPADVVANIFDSAPEDGCRAVRYDYITGAEPMVVVEVQNGGHTVRNPRTLPDNNPADERPGLTCNDGNATQDMFNWFVENVGEPGTNLPPGPAWYPEFESPP